MPTSHDCIPPTCRRRMAQVERVHSAGRGHQREVGWGASHGPWHAYSKILQLPGNAGQSRVGLRTWAFADARAAGRYTRTQDVVVVEFLVAQRVLRFRTQWAQSVFRVQFGTEQQRLASYVFTVSSPAPTDIHGCMRWWSTPGTMSHGLVPIASHAVQRISRVARRLHKRHPHTFSSCARALMGDGRASVYDNDSGGARNEVGADVPSAMRTAGEQLQSLIACICRGPWVVKLRLVSVPVPVPVRVRCGHASASDLRYSPFVTHPLPAILSRVFPTSLRCCPFQ